MQHDEQKLQGRALRSLSYAARVLIGLVSFVLFLVSIGALWDWPIARSALAFSTNAAFFLDFSKRDLGSYFAFCSLARATKLTIDTKLLGLEVLASALINSFLILGHLLSIV